MARKAILRKVVTERIAQLPINKPAMARLPKFLGSHNFQESLTLQRRAGVVKTIAISMIRFVSESATFDKWSRFR